MKLESLLSGEEYEVLQGSLEIEIEGITEKSGQSKKNFLFICIEGTKIDGHKFAGDAIKNGAKVLLVSKNIKVSKNITIIKVKDTRESMSNIASNFYGKNFSFKFVGITGTNGKTTTTFMLKSILNSWKKKVAVVGTSGVFVDEEMIRGEDLTTPDPIEMFELLAEFEKRRVDFVISEISAHALHFRKNRGIMSDIAVFSNLTQDHLDFFGSMENYGKAKASYFSEEMARIGVVNIDDELGRDIQSEYNIPIYSYSIVDSADFVAKNINLKKKSFVVSFHKTRLKIKLTLSGEYNVYNALSAISTSVLLGVPSKYIIAGLRNMKEIPGRFNIFDFENHGKVILDFAHTPDGLDKILTASKLYLGREGRLISVFGCGGNRDRAKRPIMGEISGIIADYTIISIDNPRFEDPYIVMEDVAVGLKNIGAEYEIIIPREKAIERAIQIAKKGDVIVVSGKGVEPYYEVNGVKLPYHEEEIIAELQTKYRKK